MSQRVLIVEDNEELRRMYERVFMLHHYTVLPCASGADALRALSVDAELPCALVLDVMLPDMSGIEILRHVKADPALAHIPVLILTNSIREENKEVYIASGAARFLIKMNTAPEEVVAVVAELCAAAPPPTP